MSAPIANRVTPAPGARKATRHEHSTAPRAHHFTLIALSLLALWLLALGLDPTWLGASGLSLNPHGHAHLYAHGHPFVDARTLWGVPNAMDVLSNAALVLAGGWGLLALRNKDLPTATRDAIRVFFGGLLLAGFGSAWYHWAPDASGLVLDRLGMAVTFAGALSMAVAERVAQHASRTTLRLVLVAAVVSAVLPYSHGNVLPWAVIQFGGMGLIAWAAWLPPLGGAAGIRLGGLIAIYAVAKALELNDETVFQASGEWVSGHSLKHIVAALAAWPVMAPLMRQNARASGQTQFTR